MSNVKVLARVMLARKRLRDLSAGEMAHADQLRLEADDARQQRQAEQASLFDQMEARVATIDSVRGLEILQDERASARIALQQAYAEVSRRSAVVEERRTQLHRRERDLRGTERQLDDARKAREAHINKLEQAVSDELSSAAVFRSRL